MKQENYGRDESEFWVVDPELEIDLRSELGESETMKSGKTHHLAFRKRGRLHGPSLYYGEEGALLSETWYFEGKKMGKVRRYYPTGQLYCIERYLAGTPHLRQEYYYLDGKLKTQIDYKEGQFDGETLLYWPDGAIKRKSLFSQGEKVADQFYDEEGRPLGHSERALS